MKARRRRGLVLLALALASGGLAASQVQERERRVDARVGPLVPVVVATRDLAPDRAVERRDLALERVPARFLPSDAVASPAGLAGARPAVPVPAGAYVTASLLGGGARRGRAPLRPGERAVEIGVTAAGALAGAAPGSRVDVLVSTERHDGAGRTFLALEDVQLLGLRAAGAGAEDAATAVATLRVSLRQAVYLAAADSFGHEVRLLARPAGDRHVAGPTAVGEGDL
jgi:pilus assembly protein CpaB